MVLLVYVDDILVTGNSDEGIQNLVSALKEVFVMKDLGFPRLFLGIQFIECSKGWLLSQEHYTAQLLEKASLTECNPCSTPIVYQHSYPENDVPFSDPSLFRSLAGSLLYLTLTRPDISFAVNWVCQYMHAPMNSHFLALKRILRYLSGCSSEGLLLQPGCLDIVGYADSDWAGDKEDRKSTSGYCLFLGENLIAWSAKKQPTVARSSTEAEYKALANATAEVVWVLQLLRELHSSPSSTPLLWCDNMGAIALTNNPIFHARTKHVEVDYHFIREKVQGKALCIDYIPTDHQVADMFTKPLSTPHFQRLKSQLPLLTLTARCYPDGHHLEGGCQNLTTNEAVAATKQGELEEDTVSAVLTKQRGSENDTAIAAMAAGCDLAMYLGNQEQDHEQWKVKLVHASPQSSKSSKINKETLIHGAGISHSTDAEMVSKSTIQLQSTAVTPTQQEIQQEGRVMKSKPWWRLHGLLTQEMQGE